MEEDIPRPGNWPVDPQEDQSILNERIWIDGCFDFFHHGHAGVMLQARQLGTELIVGIHSDQDILENKGPTVMNLEERISAINACRWSSKSIPHAPYVTSLPWISHYGCRYVVHGDDITSDSSGEDCYRYVKRAGRYKVVKRTPGISTTDLVGRMLIYSKSHFIGSFLDVLNGKEGAGSQADRDETANAMRRRIQEYATDHTGLAPGADVYFFHQQDETFHLEYSGKGLREGQRVIYVDGGFDLFSSGHIAFLQSVSKIEKDEANKRGWYEPKAREERIARTGEDYGPAFVVAGIHNDKVINRWKGLNYPIMNIFERGLCVLQCRYIHAIVFGAPFQPSTSYLQTLPPAIPRAVYHGPTQFMPLDDDPYTYAKQLSIFCEVPPHNFQDVNAGQIVDRILNSRAIYEERQRLKAGKAVGELAAKEQEQHQNYLETSTPRP